MLPQAANMLTDRDNKRHTWGSEVPPLNSAAHQKVVSTSARPSGQTVLSLLPKRAGGSRKHNDGQRFLFLNVCFMNELTLVMILATLKRSTFVQNQVYIAKWHDYTALTKEQDLSNSGRCGNTSRRIRSLCTSIAGLELKLVLQPSVCQCRTHFFVCLLIFFLFD